MKDIATKYLGWIMDLSRLPIGSLKFSMAAGSKE